MFGHSSLHAHFKWAKNRIDKMDAALASLERAARQVKSRSTPQVGHLATELKKRRARFEAILKTQVKDSDRAWSRSRARLEKEWKTFETRARKAVRKSLAR